MNKIDYLTSDELVDLVINHQEDLSQRLRERKALDRAWKRIGAGIAFGESRAGDAELQEMIIREEQEKVDLD